MSLRSRYKSNYLTNQNKHQKTDKSLKRSVKFLSPEMLDKPIVLIGSDFIALYSFFNTQPILNESTGGMDSIARGFLSQNAMMMDTTFVQDLSNFLFAEPGKTLIAPTAITDLRYSSKKFSGCKNQIVMN